MGLRGPKPKPTALRELEGNPGRRPNRREPRPAPACPACPGWLDEEGRAAWAALAPRLLALGLLSELDTNALAEYCDEWSMFLWAVRTIRAEGRMFKSLSGYLAPHPAVAIRRDARAALVRLAACFGMDPASRARVSAAPESEEGSDPLGDFLGGGL